MGEEYEREREVYKLKDPFQLLWLINPLLSKLVCF